ncbi:hypothetical protein [Alkalihalobacillus sp. BA299]|uniref:hypothetical protein n=1 Tax=Alkalihalobacillus sp. BA299 TaxID=2815938 RepID=UPI001ADBDD43|nr:hypothetical protein [Alkalihalobacillus sp. BA299]
MLKKFVEEVSFYKNADESGELFVKQFDTYEQAYEFIENTDCDVIEYDTVEVKTDPEMLVFVNVYGVERAYGGPEEGGWWYNTHDCLESVPVANKNSKKMKEYMEEKYAHVNRGNIYSVLGGAELAVYVERIPCQSQTRERPHYE